MVLRISACALVVWMGLVGVSRGQAAHSTVEALREQIAAMEAQLRRIERDDDQERRVTEIGSSRGRWTDDPVITVRIYDLSDLFSVTPTYPARYESNLAPAVGPVFPMTLEESGNFQRAGGGAGGMGGGGFFSILQAPPSAAVGERAVLAQAGAAAAAGGPRTSMAQLIDAIEKTIAPNDWDSVGGPGVITPLGNSLLIAASHPTHAQIEALVQQFRKRWGSLRTVSAQFWWLWLTEDQLAAMLIAPAPEGREGEAAFGLVDAEAWQRHLAGLREAQDAQRPGYHAAITCHNGQTVHALAGGQRLVNTAVVPRWLGGEEHGAVDYETVLRLVQEGAAIQLTPVTNVSGRYVVLDLHSRVNLVRERPRAAEPAADEDGQAPPQLPRSSGPLFDEVRAIERRELQTQRLSTTLRVPVDRLMLIGGMTFESLPQAGQPNLYLFAKVAVQELRDDLPRAMPIEPAQDAPADEPPQVPLNDGTP